MAGGDSDPTYEAWKQTYIGKAGIFNYLIPILPMRHGNPYAKFDLVSISDYIPILPMRHGNNKPILPPTSQIPIPILPMRHGNLENGGLNILQLEIPILPMRHGNNLTSEESRILFFRFRSYLWGMETELSPISVQVFQCIPILPMRHGNYFPCLTCFCRYNWFRSYLWGMETENMFLLVNLLMEHSDPTYEAWKRTPRAFISTAPVRIPILPMRHGNVRRIA